MLWCLYVPMLVMYNVTWAVNSICHMPRFGYRTFDTSDQSRNNLLIGVLGFGEGYHNNHHGQPRCAAHGLRWWEFDLTRYIIWTLEKCGLAWNVVWPDAEPIEESTDEEARCPFWLAPRRCLRLVAKIRPKSFLDRANRFASARGVVGDLIALDFADPEIFRFGMRKIKSAHARARMHGERFG